MTSQIAIGLGAGAASALLYFAVASGTALAMAMFYIAPLPLLVAGLGWGPLAAMVAALAGAAFAGVATAPLLGLAFFIGCSAPAAWLARLSLLGRPTDPEQPDPAIEWYPVGRLLLWAAGLGAAVVVLGALALGAGTDTLRESVEATFRRLIDEGAGEAFGLTEDVDLAELAGLFAGVLPPIAAAVWTLTMALNLWLAGRIAEASGRLPRPMPEIGTMAFPGLAAVTFVASVILSFMPGLIGLIGIVTAASLTVAYVILGLAVIHVVTRHMSGRILLLSALYVTLMVLIWALPIVAALGLAETYLRLRERVAANPGQNV